MIIHLLASLVASSVLAGSSSQSPPSSPPMYWTSVSVGASNKPLLSSTSISAHAGRLLGVIGPSGAGKSTLLMALSGTTALHRKMRVTGLRTRNVPEQERVAMLAQDVCFFGMLTVRETLTLAAELQPIANTRAAERVDELLQILGLSGIADARVGDHLHRGISGGEKRRLAVGCELLSDPSLLVADEPTTGLDAHQVLLSAPCSVLALARAANKPSRIPTKITNGIMVCDD